MAEENYAAFTRAMSGSGLSQKRPGDTCSHGDEIFQDWSSVFQQQQMEFLPFSNPFWPPSNNQPESIPIQTGVSTAQTSQAPNNSNASLLKRCNSKLSEPDRDRKRKTDQKYRERCKKTKVEMESNLETLVRENNCLKMENESLKKDNAAMNQTLRDQAKEIDQLKNNLSRLKREYGKQNVLVQTLSEHLGKKDEPKSITSQIDKGQEQDHYQRKQHQIQISLAIKAETDRHVEEIFNSEADPLRLENEKLKDENASLKKNANLNNLSLLEDENARLRTENRVLKVQNDALCGKIISDNDKKCDQEQEAKISLEDMPLMY